MSLEELISQRSLLVCVGPGGVGKTTVAAALGVRAASQGKKTLVLTIDPARRLADALGLSLGEDKIHTVDLSSIQGSFSTQGGGLDAAMFDNAQSMDRLMARVSPNAQSAEKILKNRVYRAMAGTLARSHAYLAMERLHEVMSQGTYDLVILDTPPARNALDILDAPGRLTAFLEEGVMKWFTRARQASEAKGIRGRLLSAGGAAATKLFSMVAGEVLLKEVMDFFDGFSAVRAGFFERSKAVQAQLRAPSSAFVLVSSSDLAHLDDAKALVQGAQERGLNFAASVYNRSYHRLGDDDEEIVCQDSSLDLEELFKSAVAKLEDPSVDPQVSETLLGQIKTFRQEAIQENLQGLSAVAKMHRALMGSIEPQLVARLGGDIRDVQGLLDLSRYLAYERSLEAILGQAVQTEKAV